MYYRPLLQTLSTRDFPRLQFLPYKTTLVWMASDLRKALHAPKLFLKCPRKALLKVDPGTHKFLFLPTEDVIEEVAPLAPALAEEMRRLENAYREEHM